MREIKFRAWDKDSKMFLTFDSFLGNYDDLYFGDIQKLLNQKDTVFLQYTGLKDKNGKEIYESDKVRWDDGEYVVQWSGSWGWMLKDDREDYDCPNLYQVSSPAQTKIEVIGNVYETV